MHDLLDTLFGPFEGLNVEYLYDKYHMGVDFLLYLSVLVFACRLALSRIYGDQHGRSLGTAVGVVLAISLSVTQRTLGLSAKSFGPIAAGLIILMVGLVVHNMMRHTGTGHAAGASIALIVTYFSMRAVLPEFFLWTQQNKWANYLHCLLVLAILVALWRVISALFAPHEVSALKRAVRKISDDSGRSADTSKRREAAEWRLVHNRLKKLTIRGRRECAKIIRILEEVSVIIRDNGSDERVAEATCRTLNELKMREHRLLSELSRIQKLDKRLTRFDLSQYHEFKQRYQRMNEEQRAECKRLFAEGRRKLGTEDAIKTLVGRAEAYAVQFDQSMDSACGCLEAGRTKDAESWIAKAIEQEKEAEKVIQDIRDQEKALLHLIESQIARLEETPGK